MLCWCPSPHERFLLLLWMPFVHCQSYLPHGALFDRLVTMFSATQMLPSGTSPWPS
jgi:hypothetical protein